MIKLIIFDFDGVIDNNYELSFVLSQKKFKELTREEHKKFYEGNSHLEREKLRDRDNGFDFLKHLNYTRSTQKIEKIIKKVLIDLSKRHTLGIISSNYEYGILDYLKNNQIHKLFSFTYGYETHKLKVPKFKKVLDDFKITKAECVFVTDTLGDILEAREAGIDTIAVDFGYHERERLSKGNPLKIISSFPELISALEDL